MNNQKYKNSRGEYLQEFKVEIARQFHFTGKTTTEIGNEFGVHGNTIRSLAGRFTPAEVIQLSKKEKPKGVIVLDEDVLESALILLQANGIQFEVPRNYELVTKVESKLNFS